MARHKTHQSFAPESPTIEISSMIDVCFLLLIYFLVTSTITPRETDLGMKLPGPYPTPNQQTEIDPLFIRIEASGEIFTGIEAGRRSMDSDNSVRDLPLLGGELNLYASAARAANSTPLVQIHADDRATQQRVIDVLNVLAGAGISSVTFTDLLGDGPARP
jgi:biopolymer transport protein ExbD